ncbi:MAG: Ig-like domain-containing protein [Acidobacteriota bacterium]
MTRIFSPRLAPLAIALLLTVFAVPVAAQDTDPPEIRILEGGVELLGGELFAGPVTLTIETTDASPPVDVVATVDGAIFTSGGTVSGDGLHQVAVTATDAASNRTTASLSLEIDTTPPAFGPTLPVGGTVTAAAEVTLSGEVSGAVAVTVDGQAATLVGSQWSAGPLPLAEGERTFNLVATDAAGNAAQLPHSVVRDTAAPSVSVTQPAVNSLLGQNSVDVAGLVSDPHLLSVTVNGIAASVSGGSFVALGVPLTEGSNTLTAEATDAAGNRASAGRSVTLDTQPPAVAITDPAPGTVVPGATLSISGTVADASLDRVEVGGIRATISGETWSASVPLVDGPNTLTAVAFDALGHSRSDSVSVVRDSQAPAIQITSPRDGERLATPTVDVEGTVEEEPGLSVTVNGVAATPSSGTFSASGLELLEGDNRLIARVTDSLGNQGAHTRWVYRDTVSPEFVSASPSAGALAIAPATTFTLTFSEELASPVSAGAWRLETAAGAPLASQANVVDDTLTVQPTVPLPSSASVRLILTSGLVDRAGNGLSNPQTLGFRLADVTPPPAPALSPPPPSPVCASSVPVAGTTEPLADVVVTGGAGSVSVRAASDGSFRVVVALAADRLNSLEVVATDPGGNASSAGRLEVVHDCTAPEVVGAVQSGDSFTVEFSEPVSASSLSGAVTAVSASGAVSGTVSVAGGGWQAVFTADTPLPAEPVQLSVSTAVTDVAGNGLAFPYSELFGGAVTQSFVAGRVIDAATGRPLSGALVEVVVTDGVANLDPVPGQTTGGAGRFSIPVVPGTHRLLISRSGYTQALAVATAPSGVGVDVFDPRLTPTAASVSLGAAGGISTFGDSARLEVFAGSLAAATDVTVTFLAEQALPSLLPYGWSPRGAVWVDLGGAALSSPAELSLPVDALDGSTLAVVRLDEGTLQWQVEELALVIDGRVTASLSGPGGWAVVEEDPGSTAPPPAGVGSPLSAGPAPEASRVTAATLEFDPEVVLPGQSSAATVSYAVSDVVTSGLPLTLTVQEELTLLDGSVRRGAPYEADVVVYRSPGAAGQNRTRFALVPSSEAQNLPLEMGSEDVSVVPYGGETLQGGVLGPAGGVVTTPEGDRVDLAVGALPEPTPVALARRAEASLPLPLPSAVSWLGALDLDLAGRSLASDATLTLDLGAAPTAGEAGLLLTPVDWGTDPVWRPVAQLTATARGWQTASIDPQDLPWPGVREGGVYVFAKLEIPIGYLRGTVTVEAGAPLSAAFVARADAPAPWVQVSGAGGLYALPAAVGTLSVSAVDPTTGDRGLGATSIPTAEARVDLDLRVLATGPQLISVDPSDGAVEVISGIEPVLTFSEAVAPTTLATGVQLYEGGEPLPISLAATGSVVRIVPSATLRPGAVHEIRLSTALRDLQGRRLASAVTTTFTTAESLASGTLDPSRIHLFEPATFNAQGVGPARVLGRPGAVPSGSLVFVENLTRLVSTPSVTAPSDGSFELSIDTALSDSLLLHIVPPGANESVFVLGPFLSADGRSARLGFEPEETTVFTTLDDVTVTVEPGTFLEPAVVRLEPAPLSEATAPLPSDFAYEAAYRLSIEGGEAQRGLGLELPTPAGVTADELLLAKLERILGEDHWMVHDLLRRDGDRLTTEPLEAQSGAATVARGQGLSSRIEETVIAAGSVQPFVAPARMGDRQEYLPGSANPGLYVVMSHTGFLDWVGFPYGAGLLSSQAYIIHHMIEGMITSVNQSITRLLEHDAILIPTRRGQIYTLEGRDLATGYRFFQGTFDPPTPGEITLHPPDAFDDGNPPWPVAGSPLRFFVLRPWLAGSEDLVPGLTWSFDGSLLTVNGGASPARAGAHVRLLGLDDSIDYETGAGADGSFDLTLSVVPGRRYLLAVGAEVPRTATLLLDFSEGLAPDLTGISMLDSRGAPIGASIVYGSSAAQVRITPSGGWLAGATYTLRLGPELADAAGTAWGKTLKLEFTAATSAVGDTLGLAEVRDVARMGSWLFVAAGADGLAVIDASDPAALKHLVHDDATGEPVIWPFALADSVAAVAVDPHGRVLVAGGGVTGPGQLKIFDPLALDRAAVAANPSDPSVLYAAFRGSTLVSDRIGGGTGTSLPEGLPRRVTVLSDDEIDRWRLGVEAAPDGVVLTPANPPTGGDPYRLTLTGGGGVAGQPVTVRNVDAGGLARVDADAAGGWSLTVTVEAGQGLELLRNRQTLAYLATLGVGIEVVDVSAFYGETPEDPLTPDLLSDVLGVYSGIDDPELELCNQPVSGIGSALVDLGTLFDASNAHPLTVVGLVGFRGLALFESEVGNVGSISFFNEVCLEINGSAHMGGLLVVEDYGFDWDGDGRVRSNEIDDYLIVTHRTAGVLIFNATDRDDLRLVGHVRLPGQAGEVSIDRLGRRLWVSGLGSGLYAVDFDAVPRTGSVDGNGDGLDDRVLETIALDGNTNAPALLVPELGIAFAGGLDRGLTPIGVSGPRISLLGPDGAGGWLPIDRVAPLGSPTAMVGEHELPAGFRVMAALPGGLGPQIQLDVESLGPGGLRMPDAGDPSVWPGLPSTALTGPDGLLLRRLAEQPWEEGYQMYLSDPVVTVADLRASEAYVRTSDEAAECTRCDGGSEGFPAGSPEILSGHEIAVRLPASLRSSLAGLYSASTLERVERRLVSVPWDISPALRQEPALSASTGSGDAVPGTLLHSGEMTHAATDLVVRGRRLGVAFTRTYRSQTVGTGPLGPGWELGYRVRLRELPNGAVERYDGNGRIEVFTPQPGGGYISPPGVFAELMKTSAGWTLIDAQLNLFRFDRWGRLVSMADAVKNSLDTGNEIKLAYDLVGNLVSVTDDLDRSYQLAYDAEGRLVSIEDFIGRTVTYGYDAEGRLETVTSPAVTVGESTFPSGLTTTYGYESIPTGDLATVLNARDRLASITNAKGQTWLELAYTDADGDGHADEVTGQTWGGHPLSIVYNFGAAKTTVTDRRGKSTHYTLDASGRTTSVQDPALRVTTFDYDSEGNLVRTVSPLGTVQELTFATGGDRRQAGNLLSARVDPGSGGRNGSAEFLTTPLENDPRYNLPQQLTDPRGGVVEIERGVGGLPEVIRRAVGQPEQSQAVVEYNAFGQPTRLVNDNGHEVRLEYFTSGPSRGYLSRRIVDPSGLNLATRFETDPLGQVIAVIDPRGVRHEVDYNELGWMVESRLATTPSNDGAAPLSYRTQWLHDEVGNLVEERLPFGETGTSVTRVWRTFGELGELIREEREVSLGETVATTFAYDPNLNLTRVTSPEGEITEFVYDERNLQVERSWGAPEFDPPLTAAYAYDAEGRLRSYIDPRGEVWQIAYDGYQRPMETIDPLGRAVRTVYDDGGNPVERRVVDEAGCLFSYSTAEFDRQGRQTKTTNYLWEYPNPTPCEDLPPTARALSTRLEYDGAGNLLRAIDSLGRVNELTYDGAERLRERIDAAGNVFTQSWDAAGNLREAEVTEILPGGGTSTVAVNHRYDALGRRIASTNALGDEQRWLYDARGNLRLSVDPEGFVTERTYDGLNRPTSVTQPNGVRVEAEYDRASRPVLYRDALGNETTRTYDAAGRLTDIFYPDGTGQSWEYDPAGNPTRTTDARGTVIDQTYDAVGRLLARAVVPSTGVEGPLSETFVYDALDRMVRAESGGVITEHSYDSLSRLLTETTAGHTVAYAYDDAGRPGAMQYPSGRTLGRTLDALGRPTAIGVAGSLPSGGAPAVLTERLAGFGFQGPALVASKILGSVAAPTVTGTVAYDASRRMTSTSYRGATTGEVLGEAIAWTDRGLWASHERRDLNGLVKSLSYDGKGRLTGVAASGSGGIAGLTEAMRFTYDAAENLVARSRETFVGDSTTEFPLDESGRNRPSTVNNEQLVWDAAGNLTVRGDLRFHYDFKNRLTRVTEASGAELVRYEYDAFNRRTRRTAAGVVAETAWSGLQPIERRIGGQLAERRAYGLGLDELIYVERDGDGDGSLELSYRPLYDASGNLALVVDDEGVPIERYDYSPYGERLIRVNDRTPPAVEQIRVVNDALWLELSEEVSLDAVQTAVVAGSLRLVDSLTSQTIALTVTQPIVQGPRAGRRLVLAPTPPPSAGAAVQLELGSGVLEDLFGNRLSTPEALSFPWETSVVQDHASPRVVAVWAEAGVLRVAFSEEVDLDSTSAGLQVDGVATTWSIGTDRYILEAATPLGPGSHSVSVTAPIADLSGATLAVGDAWSFTLDAVVSDELVFFEPAPDVVTASTVGNGLGFHGLEADSLTGLVYARNRWYDPSMGRFITLDPLGYVDGPNPYQYGLNNPYAFSDPLGLCASCGSTAAEFGQFGLGIVKGLARQGWDVVTGTWNAVTHPGDTARGVRDLFLYPERAVEGVAYSVLGTLGGLASSDPAEAGDATSVVGVTAVTLGRLRLLEVLDPPVTGKLSQRRLGTTGRKIPWEERRRAEKGYYWDARRKSWSLVRDLATGRFDSLRNKKIAHRLRRYRYDARLGAIRDNKTGRMVSPDDFPVPRHAVPGPLIDGHGAYPSWKRRIADNNALGSVAVPEGTSVTLWGVHGYSIHITSDVPMLGRNMEEWVIDGVDTPMLVDGMTYLPGSWIPNYIVTPAPEFALSEGLHVSKRTYLGDLLRPNMGNCNGLFCRNGGPVGP